ncbi:TatD family hydrolase [Hahella ganghwensis]|uniref:TatD family hydrolase n=1 Tax=Hahella ganghwensis TaxID=286420 RepID=UPI000366BFF1|nr:TatD family hydrolase [Hahella ganghwensis]
MSLIDSHCHLDRIDLTEAEGSLETALDQARARGVSGFLCVDIDLDNFKDVLSIAEQHEDVWCSAGIHPLAKMKAEDLDSSHLKELALSSDKVIAVGECGLDYYYDAETAPNQKSLFEKQLAVACEVGKPVIVHTREAREDTLELIRRYTPKGLSGVLHCFTESLEMAEAAIDEGFYISFSGIITFRNAGPLRDVVRNMPLDRILVETDSPYLAPVPYRGKSNQPKWVVEVAQCVADLKGVSLEELSRVTTNNFRTLFNLPAT